MTKITKYAAFTFFGLLIFISILSKSERTSRIDDIRSRVEQESKQGPMAPAAAPTSTAPTSNAPAPTFVIPTNVSAPTVDSTSDTPK